MRAASRGLAAIVVGIAAGIGLSSGAAASLNLTSRAFTPYRTCTITATPVTATAVVDSTVQQTLATTNFGTTTSLTVSSGTAINQRIYLKFDLTGCSPAIPATAIVRLATLRLYTTAVPAACRTMDIFQGHPCLDRDRHHLEQPALRRDDQQSGHGVTHRLVQRREHGRVPEPGDGRLCRRRDGHGGRGHVRLGC